MIKKIVARYKGKCSRTGAPIYPGDTVWFDTSSRQMWHEEEVGGISYTGQGRTVSNVFSPRRST